MKGRMMKNKKDLVFYKTKGGQIRVFDPNAKTKRQRTEVQRRISEHLRGRELDSETRRKLTKIQATKEKYKKQSVENRSRIRQKAEEESWKQIKDFSKCTSRHYIALDYREEFLKQFENRKKYPVHYSEGFRDVNGEDECSRWMAKIGGKVECLKEDTSQPGGNPDFMWEKKLWDLKRFGQKNPYPNPKTLRDNIKAGLNQIRYNRYKEGPGGLIIDITLLKAFNASEVKGILLKTLNDYNPDFDFVVILRSNDDIVDLVKITKK